jgi:hypothetical protein
LGDAAAPTFLTNVHYAERQGPWRVAFVRAERPIRGLLRRQAGD